MCPFTKWLHSAVLFSFSCLCFLLVVLIPPIPAVTACLRVPLAVAFLHLRNAPSSLLWFWKPGN